MTRPHYGTKRVEAPLTGLSFGRAIKVLKQGGVVRRPQWSAGWTMRLAPERGGLSPRFQLLRDGQIMEARYRPTAEEILADDWVALEEGSV
jgi:hypothetical protein